MPDEITPKAPYPGDSEFDLIRKIAAAVFAHQQIAESGSDSGSESAAENGAISVVATGATQQNGTATVAARSGRKTALIMCLKGSAEDAYYGYSSGVNASTGILVEAENAITVAYSGALFFFSTGGNANVRVAEHY